MYEGVVSPAEGRLVIYVCDVYQRIDEASHLMTCLIDHVICQLTGHVTFHRIGHDVTDHETYLSGWICKKAKQEIFLTLARISVK